MTDGGSSWGVSWGDYDNEGLLDLVFGNEGPNFLYRNAGNGTFIRITSGPTASSGGAGQAWGDYDNDGDLDLFAVGWAGIQHRLYRNNGDGSFANLTSQAAGSLVNSGGYASAVSLGDFDNDGYLDVFIANTAVTNELYHGSFSASRARATPASAPTSLGSPYFFVTARARGVSRYDLKPVYLKSFSSQL